MPSRMLYDEAIMFAQVRLKIEPPELRQGRVETITLATTHGALTRPWGIEGGFAVVYKFCKQSGEYCALRCFRVQLSQDMQFRYEHIGPYFARHIPQFTVGFSYHERGILVKEAISGSPRNNIYPIIEMDWVEGEPLLEAVNHLCEKRMQRRLLQLTEQWVSLIMALHWNHIAHGDLSGANVMVKPDGQLILVDYDGVYIPAFSDLPPLVLGEADYQHPQMTQRKFNEHMDSFSALVIYTALRALAIRPELWDKYAYNNLLFNHIDFQNPNQSVLMSELRSINDGQLQLAVRELEKACQQPIDQVRFPFHIIKASL